MYKCQYSPSFLRQSHEAIKTRIDLRNNTFTGTIPSEIGDMENLENINLQDNRFSGSLPTEMNRLDPNIELNLTGNL